MCCMFDAKREIETGAHFAAQKSRYDTLLDAHYVAKILLNNTMACQMLLQFDVGLFILGHKPIHTYSVYLGQVHIYNLRICEFV